MTILQSPIGPLGIRTDSAGRLVEIRFLAGTAVPESTPQVGAAEIERQLDEYFKGERREFALELSPTGTPFQLQVWSCLQAIPYGETRSYLQIARELGNPAATRAVGMANGRNPIPIVVPCHRVIGANGSLTGFGGGLPIKKALLELEAGQRSTLF